MSAIQYVMLEGPRARVVHVLPYHSTPGTRFAYGYVTPLCGASGPHRAVTSAPGRRSCEKCRSRLVGAFTGLAHIGASTGVRS